MYPPQLYPLTRSRSMYPPSCTPPPKEREHVPQPSCTPCLGFSRLTVAWYTEARRAQRAQSARRRQATLPATAPPAAWPSGLRRCLCSARRPEPLAQPLDTMLAALYAEPGALTWSSTTSFPIISSAQFHQTRRTKLTDDILRRNPMGPAPCVCLK